VSDDDERLLRAWRDGDQEAGNALVDRHFSTVYRFFRSKVDDDVEDLTQRTFLASLEGLERLRRDRDFRAYLLGIARRLLLRRFRDQAIRGRYENPMMVSAAELGGSPSQEVAAADERRLLLLGLRRIPLDLQICLELHYWEGMAVADIAEVLGVPPGTVKSRLHRAREQLRLRIQDMHDDANLVESTISDLARWAEGLKEQLDSEDRS
jgi:RNA polymerase sigma-70 factor (ECF subfamily)